jgi:hypothetical protein
MDLQPVDFMSALGPLPDPLKAMQDEQATKLALQGASLHNEAQGQALAEHQRSVQRQAGFGAAFRDYLTHPTTTGLISLFGDYPEFHDQLKEAHSALDEDQQRVNTTQLGSVAALAAKGDYKGAAAILQRRIDADRAAGQDTSDDQEILDHLNDPDPAKQKGAMALTTIALAGAVGPDKAAAFLKANGLSNEPFTLSQGQVRYGPDGKPIASVAPKQEYLVIPEGGKAVPVGPGGPQAAGTIDGNPSPAPAGAPASGSPHRVQGWTPRARDGGDNPDHVVDAKVARLASVVGVDPDTPLTPQQLGALATALPATEGGPGSLAARNNNPGNIKDGPGTLYGNPKPGYTLLSNAQATARGLDPAKRWQTGPDGQTAPVGDAPVVAPGDPNKTGAAYLSTVPAGMATQIKALAEGRLPLPSSFALSKPYWQRLLQATAQYDPTFDAATAKARQQAVQQFTGNGKAAQLVASVNRVANHLQTLYDASEKLVGPDTGFGPLNSMLAYGGQRFQPQSLKAYNSALPLVAGELEKIARGSTGTLHGVEQIMNNLSPNESLPTRRQAIKTAIELIHGAIDPLQNQYNSAFSGSSARPTIPWVTPRSQQIYDRLSGEDFSLRKCSSGRLNRRGL